MLCVSADLMLSFGNGSLLLGVERTAVERSVTHRRGLRWEVDKRQGHGALGSIPHLWGKKIQGVDATGEPTCHGLVKKK